MKRFMISLLLPLNIAIFFSSECFGAKYAHYTDANGEKFYNMPHYPEYELDQMSESDASCIQCLQKLNLTSNYVTKSDVLKGITQCTSKENLNTTNAKDTLRRIVGKRKISRKEFKDNMKKVKSELHSSVNRESFDQFAQCCECNITDRYVTAGQAAQRIKHCKTATSFKAQETPESKKSSGPDKYLSYEYQIIRDLFVSHWPHIQSQFPHYR